MKIMVIGGNARSRLETVERLRRDGHSAVAALPGCRVRFSTDAPRDPGHAGRHLRAFLETAFAMTGELRRFRWRRAQQAGVAADDASHRPL